MAKEMVEVTHEKSETVTEKVEILLCDLCGREVKNGGRRYFGYHVEHTDEDEPDDEGYILNSFVVCGKCNERLQ